MNIQGSHLQTVLGDDYDLIGFDPRYAHLVVLLSCLTDGVYSGIGFTTPKVQVFSDPAEKAVWDLRYESIPAMNSTPDALARNAARWAVFGDLAAQRMAEPGQFVGTAAVARDMVRMAEAYGESRVRFWGFSYGSVLGITFAAMFPDRVERLIVDGVVDTYDYYEGELDS
jgi:pimeloyl-ACP methyl ester carboxylesterase